MKRLLISAVAPAAALPLLLDASLKSVALLLAAALCALAMRRASAAARHVVWLSAVVALLILPVLTIALPGWRILPAWARVPAVATAAAPSPVASPTAAAVAPSTAPYAPPRPHEILPTTIASEAPANGVHVAMHPAPEQHTAPPPPRAPSPLLPLWLAGSGLLLLRLLLARWNLGRNCRRCSTASPCGRLEAALRDALRESGVRGSVTLLVDDQRTIPVVWGIVSPRLLMPTEAETWPAEQLRSVLLHELAHLRRHDPLAQFLAQLACALHWFNPLVWLAAWRLHVERERACDDMVLASGVRPSTYAEHLLHIATQLSPARWTQACGLAMARKSSIEGRLTAVLSDKLNRLRLTRALTTAAILLSAAIAVPVAMLRAQEETGKPGTQAAEDEPSDKSELAQGKQKLPTNATHGRSIPEPGDGPEETAALKTPARRYVDWSISGPSPDFKNPFSVEKALELAAQPAKSESEIHQLRNMILQASVEKAPELQPLLKNEALKRQDDKDQSLTLALSAYDYSVNGNKEALQLILDQLAKGPPGPAIALETLLFVDEWDLTMAAAEDHFSRGGEHLAEWENNYWNARETLYPDAFTFVPSHGIGIETEAQLDWGDSVNGLRGAIIIRPTAPGAEQGIYLVVQNVSDKPLHFADTIGAKDLRKMYLSDHKGILAALTSSDPTMTDVKLSPREVTCFRLLEPVASSQKSMEPTMIEGLRKDALQTWRAVLNIQDAPDGAWKGSLSTGETRGAVSTEGPQPKNKEAQALYKVWLGNARLNGDIPGGLVRLLHEKVQEFIRNNEPDASGAPYAAKMKPLEPRFAHTGDWKPADVIALMDDIATASAIPLETSLEHLSQNTLQPGQSLPPMYQSADWGQPLPGGLRMAYVLEPRSADYHLGTEVRAHMILHNAGKEPVSFITHGFQQPPHTAQLSDGTKLTLNSTYWTTLGRPAAYRLAPGECCEIHTPGLGIGARDQNRDDWSNVRAGSWIPCKVGDDVRFSPGPALLSRRNEEPDNDGWWLEFVTQRLKREEPLPSDIKEREYVLYRVVRDLYGTAPSTTEGDAFAADRSPDALKNLATLLAKHPYGTQVHGPIKAGDTAFKVLPPDAEASKRVHVASGPGYYNLTDNLKFSVTRLPLRTGTTNSGSLIFFQQGKDNAITKVELPDAYNTWAAAVEPGEPILWIKQKDLVRSYDFTDPASIKETRYEGSKSAEAPIPPRVLEAMKPILAAPEAPVQQQNSQPPAATPAKSTAERKNDDVTPARPTREYAQRLFAKWQARARTDGKIPGALIGQLAQKVDEFVRQQKDTPEAGKLSAVRPRLDASHDWAQSDVVALLDEIEAIHSAPIGWSDMPIEFDRFRQTKRGGPLPEALESAAWGQPAENGLRAAWLLEPTADSYAHGTVVKARVLFHNTGHEPVTFRTETWHQSDPHVAKDAGGKEIKVTATFYTGITPLAIYRLEPGEYCEVQGHGLAIGAGEYTDEFSAGRIGAVIEAAVGTEVSLSHTVDAAQGIQFSRPDDPKAPDELWKKTIAERVAEEAPLPTSKADREQLIQRVTLDLTGTPPPAEEVTAFVSDKSPDALGHLTSQLQAKPHSEPWTGKLSTGVTKFRVTAADPEAAKKPRVATTPGRYVLGDGVELQLTQISSEGRRENKAQILFRGGGGKTPAPHDIALPDGLESFAIVWVRGTGELKVVERGSVRTIDFRKPDAVTEERAKENLAPEWKALLPAALSGTVSVDPASRSMPGPAPQSGAPAGESGPTFSRTFAGGALSLRNFAAPPGGGQPTAQSNRATKPERTHLFNATHSAIAVQSGTDVRFVLAAQGMLSSGIGEWETTKPKAGWGFEGTVNLVDVAKTKAAGHNVDLRSFKIRYTSDEPDVLYLDGKPLRLGDPGVAGRLITLREKGDPEWTSRILPLHTQADLEAIARVLDDKEPAALDRPAAR